jgi:hypothetical protein
LVHVRKRKYISWSHGEWGRSGTDVFVLRARARALQRYSGSEELDKQEHLGLEVFGEQEHIGREALGERERGLRGVGRRTE